MSICTRSSRKKEFQKPIGHSRYDAIATVFALGLVCIFASHPASSAPTSPSAVDAVATGTIAGVVQDSQGMPFANALVLLCEQASGLPIHSVTGLPFLPPPAQMASHTELLDWKYAITDSRGAFSIAGVRAGEYRLLAQAWSGSDVPPKPMEVNGAEVRYLGRKDHLRVPSPEAGSLILKSEGTCGIRLAFEIGNSDCYVMVGLAAPSCDPVLGFLGWDNRFVSGLIAWNRMPYGQTTLLGLPAGSFHVALFANDNNPGFGAADIELREGEIADAKIPIVASWSTGHKNPPPRLEKLFNDVLAGKVVITALLDSAPGQRMPRTRDEITARFGSLDRAIPLPDGTTATVAELLAVDAYAQLHARKVRPARPTPTTAPAPTMKP